jgi:hypothetical protein
MRTFAIINIVGYNDFIYTDEYQYNHLLDKISKIPSWPDHGSVTLLDEINVVKFSEITLK